MAYLKYSPTVLVILDGFGFKKNVIGNAPALASMPTWHRLLQEYSSTLLHASGEYVGLLPGYAGNSEVGHLTLGAGRVIKSILKKFHEAISDGSFFENKLLIENFTALKKHNQALHLIGLLSDGGVHSHDEHLHALIQLASKVGLKQVFIHAFLDGRDVAPQSAAVYLERLEALCNQLQCGTVATLHGRFYAMDRDTNWDRTEATYNLLINSRNHTPGFSHFSSWQDALKVNYQQNITDEFISPCVLDPDGFIKPGDGVLFFNFRPDRARQLTTLFLNNEFRLAFFISTTCFEKNFKNPVLFEQEYVHHTLLDELETQLPEPYNKIILIAETEKYAHVTYFFKGMREEQASNEQPILVPSLKVKNYVEHPEMSASKITEQALESLRTNPSIFYLINYANADMVGHSGNLEATVKACEYLDQQLTLLFHEVVEKRQGTLFITADHGNAEEKIDAQGKSLTAHTTNPVFFVAVGQHYKLSKQHMSALNGFGLANVAPTILKHLGLNIPIVMEKKAIF